MKGDVTVQAVCLLPDRLLERAMARGLRFDSVERPDERTLRVRCGAGDANALLTLCGRYSIPAQVLSRRRASALAAFARRRATLPVAIAIAGALCALFLSRVWRVEIAFSGEAAEYGDRPALERTLAELGVVPGLSRGIDAAQLARTLLASAPSYSFFSVHLQGVRLLVEAVPELPAPQVYDVDAARDLVSDRDGVVVRAIARSGALCVAPGDVVRRGQLLIRGEEKLSDDQTRPIAALGEVVVRAWYTGDAKLPLSSTRAAYTGRVCTGSSLSLMGLRWPISPGGEYEDQQTETEYLPVGGLFLPLEIERTTRREIRLESVDADADTLRNDTAALARADAARSLSREQASDCDIRDSWLSYELSGDALSARAVYEIYVNAAVTREALQGG